MDEKRRNKRFYADLKLTVSTLFKQDNVKITHTDAPIEVTNVSRGGIGFVSESVLPEGYYFNASVQLGDKDDILYSVIKIIRAQKIEGDKFRYGAEFVGMPSILDYIFEKYEETSEEV